MKWSEVMVGDVFDRDKISPTDDPLECTRTIVKAPEPDEDGNLWFRWVSMRGDEANAFLGKDSEVSGLVWRLSPRTETTEGTKHDSGKPRPASLLPWDALCEVLKVLEYGATKYGADNWRQVTNGIHRYEDAQARHFLARKVLGETHDAETGILHRAHEACNALFLVAFELEAQRKAAGVKP